MACREHWSANTWLVVPEPARVVVNEVRPLRLSREAANVTTEVKRTGEVPRCSNCQTNDLSCVYEQARRDRLQESVCVPVPVVTSTKFCQSIDLNQTFISLFRELGSQLCDDGRRRVQDVIDAVSQVQAIMKDIEMTRFCL